MLKTDNYKLITGATLEIPVYGNAEVVQKKNNSKSTSNSLRGWGIYTSLGATDEEWDLFLYYSQRTLSFDLIPSGKNQKLKFSNYEYGLGVGYTF